MTRTPEDRKRLLHSTLAHYLTDDPVYKTVRDEAHLLTILRNLGYPPEEASQIVASAERVYMELRRERKRTAREAASPRKRGSHEQALVSV